MEARGSSTPVITAPETWRKRENLWHGLILLVLTLTAWVYTIDQAQAMGGMAVEGMGQASNLTLFLVSWVIMMVAMMLPAALPLILLYRVVAHKRLSPNQALAGMVVLLVGYLGIWTIAGLPVYAYSLAATSQGVIMGLVPGLLLVAGGAYQFTALKQGCHSRCSNPLFFLMQKWRPGLSGALRLGVLHGIDCLGCCLGLMVALVGLGMMNLAWMLSAAVIIFIEKTLPWGHRVARPLGVLLVMGGLVLLAQSLRGSGGMGMPM